MADFVVTVRVPAVFSMSIEADDTEQADIEARKIVEKYTDAEELSKDFYVDLDHEFTITLIEKGYR